MFSFWRRLLVFPSLVIVRVVVVIVIRIIIVIVVRVIIVRIIVVVVRIVRVLIETEFKSEFLRILFKGYGLRRHHHRLWACVFSNRLGTPRCFRISRCTPPTLPRCFLDIKNNQIFEFCSTDSKLDKKKHENI